MAETNTTATNTTASTRTPSTASVAAASDDTLLSPQFMRQLDRLDVVSRKILAGKLQGERRSKKKGQSVEFADYRNYVPGDDLRFIDWNLYARLDKLFLRLFMEEEDLSVSVLLDTSRSMDYGEPNKLAHARRVAAALGYIGLSHYNRVSVFALGQSVDQTLMNLRGRRPVPQMLDFLTRLSVQPAGNLAAALKRFSLLQRQKGVVVLISDFFEKGDLTDAFKHLGNERYDAYAIQLLAPQETDPAKAEIVGDLRLVDVEDQDAAEVSVTPSLIKRYKANLQAYCEHVRERCFRRGIAYLFAETSVPFETLVLKYLRERGVLG